MSLLLIRVRLFIRLRCATTRQVLGSFGNLSLGPRLPPSVGINRSILGLFCKNGSQPRATLLHKRVRIGFVSFPDASSGRLAYIVWAGTGACPYERFGFVRYCYVGFPFSQFRKTDYRP
jgi:hypothetical protein